MDTIIETKYHIYSIHYVRDESMLLLKVHYYITRVSVLDSHLEEIMC